MAQPATILLLGANPSETTRLSIDREFREIDERLHAAEHRGMWNVEQGSAVRAGDLQACLLRYEPRIVHFSGHGSAEGELLLEDETGEPKPVTATALAGLFEQFRKHVRCVVLNACFSAVQADGIAQHVDCVVGMTTALGDEAAIAFAGAFYQALGYGRDVQAAFDLGRNQIDLAGLEQAHVPLLIVRPGVNPRDLRLMEPPPEPVRAHADAVDQLHERSLRWAKGTPEETDPWRNIRYLQEAHPRFTRDDAGLMYEAARHMHARRTKLVRCWGLAALGIALAAGLVVSAIAHGWLANRFGPASAVIMLLLVTVILVLIGRELKQYCLDDDVRRRDAWNDSVNKLAQRRRELGAEPQGA